MLVVVYIIFQRDLCRLSVFGLPKEESLSFRVFALRARIFIACERLL